MPNLEPHELHGLFVVVNDGKVLFYDTRDSSELYDDALEIADAYFKRSYAYSRIPEHHRSKIFPLGLNYELYVGGFDRYEFTRFPARKSLFYGFSKNVLKNIAVLTSLRFYPNAINMCSQPKPDQEPRVLFMVRAWDPDKDPPGLPSEQREEYVRINETRARCIDLLSRQLGSRFCGGFAHTDYAITHFKNLLIRESGYSEKRNYVSLLRKHPIGVATTGLHGSIGWKMGEYVAFSKAIVSEKLNYLVPCGFKENRNYLEFDTPEQCVSQTMELVENSHLRQQMMENNWDYYRRYLSPDKFVLRTLSISVGS